MSAKKKITPKSHCLWSQDTVDDFYETSCGNAWQFTNDGPKENGCKFCMYCGKPITVEPAK